MQFMIMANVMVMVPSFIRRDLAVNRFAHLAHLKEHSKLALGSPGSHSDPRGAAVTGLNYIDFIYHMITYTIY